MAIVWSLTRPTPNVAVFGPQGQQVVLSEGEARTRVQQAGWTYWIPDARDAVPR
jgi:hypothetical protein